MPYYGDSMRGDPGLFSFVKKIKLGRIIGGVVKQALPIGGVLTAVNAIREAAGGRTAVRPVTVAPPPVVQVPAPLTASPVMTARRAAKRRRRAPARRRLSPLAQSRRRRLQSRGYRV